MDNNELIMDKPSLGDNPQIKRKILLVDDEPDMLVVSGALLESYGYEIFLAKTGLEALETIKRVVPDLIILDLMIPEVDGYQICGILKHDKRYLGIPIIILSARFSEQDQKTAKLLKADAYITKPFEPNTLLTEISALLNKPSSAPKRLIGEAKSL